MTSQSPRPGRHQHDDEHPAPRPGRADHRRARRGQDRPQIAAEYGHSRQTVRSYALGRRAPGEFTAREDSFAPFAAYCRRRLGDDPHLRAMPLLAEITGLGFPGTGKTFYRALERHGIRPHPCPDCHVARISGYALRPPGQVPRPFRLAAPLSPVGGETLASFLRRLADANRTTLDALLGILHPWFSIRNQWHDDRWQHEKLAPWPARPQSPSPQPADQPPSHSRKHCPLSGRTGNSPPGPSPHAVSARRPSAYTSRSRLTSPPAGGSASGTASGCPRTEHRSSASVTAPTSWTPSAGHAGCSAAAPPNSFSTSPCSPPAKPVNDPGSAGQ